MFCTSFVNKKYADPPTNIFPASISSSMINQPIECTNRPNAIPGPVRMRAMRTCKVAVTRNEFNPLPHASNGAQIFKPPNCLSYRITKRETLYLMHSR